MFKLWGRNTSSNVQKVRWLCAELELRYEQTEVGGSFGRTREPFYRAMNPNSLVPTIEDNGFTLYESNAIMRYLANKHLAHDIYPVALHARADCERWLDWNLSALGPAITPSFWGLIRTPAAQRDPAAILASASKTFDMLAIVEDRLANNVYLCGPQLTLADIGTGIQTHRWFNMPFDDIGYQRPELPNLASWYQRLTQRKPFQDTVMIPLV